jgi:SAM-dependent methyltransferase
MWAVGLISLVAGLALLIYVPTLPAISATVLLFAGFHLAGAVVSIASLYVLTNGKVLSRHRRKQEARFDFGWVPAWTYGPWIAALICAATAVAAQTVAPSWWPLAMGFLLLSATFFAGGLVTNASGRYDDAFLPMVNLLPRLEGRILDGGCGAGRTTVALGRAYRGVRIVALDRFDSDYIDGGGQQLLVRNLRLANLTSQVDIERGDLTALPFLDATFDAAVSAHAIDHLGAQTPNGLLEMLRVLKPGGRFLLIVSVPGWTMFAVANVLSFLLVSKHSWRRMATDAGFAIADEGRFNGNWFALLQKPEASARGASTFAQH